MSRDDEFVLRTSTLGAEELEEEVSIVESSSACRFAFCSSVRLAAGVSLGNVALVDSAVGLSIVSEVKSTDSTSGRNRGVSFSLSGIPLFLIEGRLSGCGP